MGRVNYSVQMNHQYKGIKDGVIVNGAFQSEWEIYSLPMDNLDQVDFFPVTGKRDNRVSPK